jgi:hypothetical protein
VKSARAIQLAVVLPRMLTKFETELADETKGAAVPEISRPGFLSRLREGAT